MLPEIELLAVREGKQPEEIYAEIQSAIDVTWANRTNRLAIIALTGHLRKPTVEELIRVIVAKVVRDHGS